MEARARKKAALQVGTTDTGRKRATRSAGDGFRWRTGIATWGFHLEGKQSTLWPYAYVSGVNFLLGHIMYSDFWCLGMH